MISLVKLQKFYKMNVFLILVELDPNAYKGMEFLNYSRRCRSRFYDEVMHTLLTEQALKS